MNILRFAFILWIVFFISGNTAIPQDNDIPLPEHPRPDFNRLDWVNLNGHWDFIFDGDNSLESLNLQKESGIDKFQDRTEKILVPFPWGSPLSGVPDSADIGWYHREIEIPENWEGKRVFLIIGAADWHTKAWLDGRSLGEHKGGYTPFEFELTQNAEFGSIQSLWIKIDDTEHSFKLYGKQGYGNARGIWQTVYLEARGDMYTEYIHVMPDIDNSLIKISGALDKAAPQGSSIEFKISDKKGTEIQKDILLDKGEKEFNLTVDIEDQRLWTLEDPFLYDLQGVLKINDTEIDEVHTYFGMRKISVMNVPGTEFPYVALNNKPVYLQMSLDQAYHPEGFYTFPTDDFMRDEIIRSKKIGLNGQRIHVKIGIPRKLYWADKLGMLIMADVPNSWGEPDENMQRETEYALQQMIRRDFNHPSIFSWVIFNETWGLFTKSKEGEREYMPGTQNWVAEMYDQAKKLDPTRLVEDNSPCNYDHVKTDLNTWHAYLPGYEWENRLDQFTEQTYPGSGWNFVEGYTQENQPNINSECGNVWGYTGSTGDVDWSWDYHQMINAFRKHPKIAGWLYTEHHDVINEWNGYYRYDRSEKETGLESFNGMSLNDLHKYIQITPDIDLCIDENPGNSLEIPLYLSVFTDLVPARELNLKYFFTWTNEMGEEKSGEIHKQKIAIKPWMQDFIDPLKISLPDEPGLAVLNFMLESPAGNIIHRNFTTFRLRSTEEIINTDDNLSFVGIDPASFTSSDWSLKQWNVLDNKKVNGAGYGYFTYEVEIPDNISTKNIDEIVFRAELSAKRLHGKDKYENTEGGGDYMRGKGLHDPSQNPNSYPMTDEITFPSMVRIYFDNILIGEFYLKDDPADHRGVLSWHAQKKDRKLREAGSYGYLMDISVPLEKIPIILQDNKIQIRLEVPEGVDGGMAVYGKDFGRYPFDPMLIFYHE